MESLDFNMKEQLPKFQSKDFDIEIINKSHEKIIKRFKTYEKDLYDFLIDDALDNQEKNISVTYLWFLKGTNDLVGYITLLTDSISLNSQLKEEFQKKNIKYKSLPALKIGRLCVDNRYLRRDLGRLMIHYAFSLAIKFNKEAGCRFITLDAMRNLDNKKDPLHFYKKLDFEVLRIRDKGTIPMYMDLQHIIQESLNNQNLE